MEQKNFYMLSTLKCLQLFMHKYFFKDFLCFMFSIVHNNESQHSDGI